jgi:hypothetical protein
MKKQGIDFAAILAGTAGSIVGGVGAACLKKLPINSKIANGIAIAVGAMLPVIVPDNKLIESVGSGMAAVGGQKLLADVTGSSLIAGCEEISGVEIPSVSDDNALSGIPSVSDDNALSGIPSVSNNSALSGIVNPNAVGMD